MCRYPDGHRWPTTASLARIYDETVPVVRPCGQVIGRLAPGRQQVVPTLLLRKSCCWERRGRSVSSAQKDKRGESDSDDDLKCQERGHIGRPYAGEPVVQACEREEQDS